MHLDIQEKNLANDGEPSYIVQEVTVGKDASAARYGDGAKIELRPEYPHDQLSASITISAKPRENLNSIFLVESGRDGLVRVGGTRKGNSSHHEITNPEDIAKLAAKIGIPVRDIEAIGYQQGNDNKITEMRVTFRYGIDDTSLAVHQSVLIEALEDVGCLPNSTAFQMGLKGLVDLNTVEITTTTKCDRLEPIRLTPKQNSTGVEFRLEPTPRDGTRIHFGRYAEVAGAYDVSPEEFGVAQTMSKAIGGNLIGEGGTSAVGVQIYSADRIDVVLDRLGEAGVVDPMCGLSLTDLIDSGGVTLPTIASGRAAALAKLKANSAAAGPNDTGELSGALSTPVNRGGGRPARNGAVCAPM